MTYLELVNGVLTRLREDTVGTLTNQDDVVVNMVKELVNDAKHTVETSHTWNPLQTEWTITTSNGTAAYTLTNAGKYATLEHIVDASGNVLPQKSKHYVRHQPATNNNKPQAWVVDGTNNGDLQLKLFPTPDDTYSYTAYGYALQADLSGDTDVVLVPYKPVLYLALALAARERGEVGGQTATELFGMAQQYLSDAIAYDASLDMSDDIWYAY